MAIDRSTLFESLVRWNLWGTRSFGDLHPRSLLTEIKPFLNEPYPIVLIGVRREADLKEHKIFLTGSSAKLMSSEISTLLTGRHFTFTVFPLSFREYLNWKNIAYESEIDQAWKPLQVSFSDLMDEKTKNREIRGLLAAMNFFNQKEGLILSDDLERTEEFSDPKKIINILPVWKFLLKYF